MKLKLFRVLCLFVVFSMVLSIAPSVLADTSPPAQTTAPQPTNAAPVVDAGAGATINTGDTFSSSGSFTDADSSSWTATVDYGDGAEVVALDLNPDNTFSLSHLSTTAGSYNVVVAVSDGEASGSDNATVVVNEVAPTVEEPPVVEPPANESPVVEAGPDATIIAGDNFTSAGSFTDTDNSTAWTATVDYGDGSGAAT